MNPKPPKRLKAYAKINLFLEITGKRADGYHTLSTIFQRISLADELSFQPAERLQLQCSDSSLPTDERNLAFRAARLLQSTLKTPRGAKIHLKKVVPMGAGLGGGSSDAAAVLTGLQTLWKKRAVPRIVHQRSVKLGADVPFFLNGGLCAAGGIGDRLRPLPPMPKTWFVLVYPGFGVATKEAYARVKLPFTQKHSMRSMIDQLASKDPVAWSGLLFNRFEELVFPDHPELPRLKQALLDAGAIGALMSGSGSSVFGVVRSEADGRRVLKRLRKTYRQSWLVHTI